MPDDLNLYTVTFWDGGAYVAGFLAEAATEAEAIEKARKYGEVKGMLSPVKPMDIDVCRTYFEGGVMPFSKM